MRYAKYHYFFNGLYRITAPFKFDIKKDSNGIELVYADTVRESDYKNGTVEKYTEQIINAMKSPEQKITDLEKRQEEITKEISELKKELKPKERTLFQIRQDWQKTSSNVIIKRARERKVQAICDLLAVADELNEGWEPDWSNHYQDKISIWYDYNAKKNQCVGVIRVTEGFVYFKNKELAEKAITILGEEKIKLALS